MNVVGGLDQGPTCQQSQVTTQSTLTSGLSFSFRVMLLWKVRELHPQRTGGWGSPRPPIGLWLPPQLGSALHFSDHFR